LDAPITNYVTGQRITGPDYFAQLYYGMSWATESQLVPLTNPPAVVNSLGYITTGSGGGTRYTDPAILPGGVLGSFQVRVWSAVLGQSWEMALSTWLSGTGWPFDPAIVVAKSELVLATPTIAPTPPALLVGLKPFAYVPIPEPTVLALGTAGLLVLVLRRLKTRREASRAVGFTRNDCSLFEKGIQAVCTFLPSQAGNAFGAVRDNPRAVTFDRWRRLVSMSRGRGTMPDLRLGRGNSGSGHRDRSPVPLPSSHLRGLRGNMAA
jgi:hypothetical protein